MRAPVSRLGGTCSRVTYKILEIIGRVGRDVRRYVCVQQDVSLLQVLGVGAVQEMLLQGVAPLDGRDGEGGFVDGGGDHGVLCFILILFCWRCMYWGSWVMEDEVCGKVVC